MPLQRVEKPAWQEERQGFYAWSAGKAAKRVPARFPPWPGGKTGQTTDRPGRAAGCADGVVADGELADAGVIFGTGFEPLFGGPLNYRSTTRVDVAALTTKCKYIFGSNKISNVWFEF